MTYFAGSDVLCASLEPLGIVLFEKLWKSKILASFLGFFKQNDDFLIIFWCFFLWFPRFCLIFSFEAKPAKIIEKSSFCLKKMKIQDFGKFSCFFQAKRSFFDDFFMIFIVLLEKPWKSKILASFLGFFMQNDDFLVFFDDFLCFFF